MERRVGVFDTQSEVRSARVNKNAKPLKLLLEGGGQKGRGTHVRMIGKGEGEVRVTLHTLTIVNCQVHNFMPAKNR